MRCGNIPRLALNWPIEALRYVSPPEADHAYGTTWPCVLRPDSSKRYPNQSGEKFMMPIRRICRGTSFATQTYTWSSRDCRTLQTIPLQESSHLRDESRYNRVFSGTECDTRGISRFRLI